jgi:hypothetical protein
MGNSMEGKSVGSSFPGVETDERLPLFGDGYVTRPSP